MATQTYPREQDPWHRTRGRRVQDRPVGRVEEMRHIRQCRRAPHRPPHLEPKYLEPKLQRHRPLRKKALTLTKVRLKLGHGDQGDAKMR